MRIACLLALALLLGGCFQITSVLTVRADGSATLRDEVVLTGLARMALAEADDETDGSMSRDAAEERAARLGEGVRLVSYEVSDSGYVAVYDVDDVRQLRYAPTDMSDELGDAPLADATALTFAFDAPSDGDAATLRIAVPKPEMEKPGQRSHSNERDAEGQAQALAMARSFFEDARIRVAIEVEGEILSTNASHVDDRTVTVFDLPLDAMFEAIEAHPAWMQSETPPTAELLGSLRQADGVQIQEPGTVRVRFR